MSRSRKGSPAPLSTFDLMADLGTVSATGPAALTTGVSGAYTASITEKPEDAQLCWEGVDFDLFNAATGGLTGEQDHNPVINLTFTQPGSYYIKAGYSSVTAENSPQYSTPIAVTVEAPVIEPPAELNSNAQYQVASILYWYRRWHNRDLLVKPIDSASFTISAGGKLGNNGVVANPPTEGEKKRVADWLTERWDGEITISGDSITLKCVGSGNFHPGGGGAPVSVQGA